MNFEGEAPGWSSGRGFPMNGHPPQDNIDGRMSVREAGMRGEPCDGSSHGRSSTQAVLMEGGARGKQGMQGEPHDGGNFPRPRRVEPGGAPDHLSGHPRA